MNGGTYLALVPFPASPFASMADMTTHAWNVLLGPPTCFLVHLNTGLEAAPADQTELA